MDDYTSYAEELQSHESAPLLCPDHLKADEYSCCPWAKSVVGLDPLSEQYVLVSVTCKRWGCPYCARRKVRRLAWMSKNANPSRLLTLTVSDKRFADGKEAWEKIAPAFPELIRSIRKSRGECEYLRVLEVQKNGMPHFHCMLRCGFVPQTEMLKEWRRLIGSPNAGPNDDPTKKVYAGVNVKRIDQTFATFRYLVKYLTKLHKIEWTDRHVSYSKNFFRPEDKEEVAYAKLDEIEHYDVHPFVYLQERYTWDHVKLLGDGRYLLGAELRQAEIEVDPRVIGLPSTQPVNEVESTRQQKLVPGMEDVDVPLDDTRQGPKKRSKRKNDPYAPF